MILGKTFKYQPNKKSFVKNYRRATLFWEAALHGRGGLSLR